MITSGNTEIKNIYYNGKAIKKVFSCGNYVWSGDTPTPPTPTGGTKFYATYIDSSTYSADCDGNSKLVKGDFSGHTTSISGISTISIGECITEIDKNLFFDGRLSSVTFPNSLQTIGSNSFAQCNYLTSVNIPSGVTTIGSSAFYYDIRLKDINIPSGVSTIDISTFQNCFVLSSCTIPNDSVLTKIGQSAFKSCLSLTNINIPSTVNDFGQECFMYCSGLTSIYIPFGTLILQDGMLCGCKSLTSVTIPSTVYEIRHSALSGCTSLQYIECLAQFAPELGNTVFKDTNNCPIYVPDASVEDYKTAPQWSSGYADRIKPISEKP